jgi:hypothetical protein
MSSMAWTIGWLIATIGITLMWHSIDPKGDFWLVCAFLASGVLLTVVTIHYWMFMIPLAVLASLVSASVWYIRQLQRPTPALARVVNRRN